MKSDVKFFGKLISFIIGVMTVLVFASITEPKFKENDCLAGSLKKEVLKVTQITRDSSNKFSSNYTYVLSNGESYSGMMAQSVESAYHKISCQNY